MTKTKQSPEKELHPSDQHPYGALVFDDREVPHYELAADVLRWRFTINLDGTRTPPFLVDAKPYTETSAIAYLKDKEGEVRPSREEQGADIIPGSLEADPVFFDRHVIQTTFRGKVIPESEMEALSGQFNFKKRVVDEGFMGFFRDEEADIEAGSIRDLLAFNQVRMRTALADELGTEHKISLAHIHRPKTSVDSLKYSQARKERVLKKGARKITFNYQQLGALYDSLVTSLRGFLVNGEPCTEENRADWQPLVPFFIKRYTIVLLFADEVDRGN